MSVIAKGFVRLDRPTKLGNLWITVRQADRLPDSFYVEIAGEPQPKKRRHVRLTDRDLQIKPI